MIISKHRFSLEIQCAHSQISIPVKVEDTGTKFYIALTDGGKSFKIPDGTLAMLSIRRPDGSFLQAFCPIKNNTIIEYDFMQNTDTAAIEGIHNCELTLSNATTNSVISTSWFTMIVSEKVVNSDSINITTENRDLIHNMLAAEASRQEKETAREAAESDRVNAEEERVLAENARQSAFNGTINEAKDLIDTIQAILDSGKLDVKDGYTPQKYIDYFTDSDINEIVARVLAVIPAVELYDGTVEVI